MKRDVTFASRSGALLSALLLCLLSAFPCGAEFSFEDGRSIVFAPKYVTPLPDSALNPSVPDGPLFKEASAALKAGRTAQAESLFLKIERMNGLLGSHAMLLRSLALLSENRPGPAVVLADSLLAGAKTRELGGQAVLECLKFGAPYDPAERGALIGRAQEKSRSPELMARAARFYLILRDTASALQAMEKLLKQRTRSGWQDSVFPAFDSLITAATRPVDDKTLVLAQYLEWRMDWARMFSVSLNASAKAGPFQERFLHLALAASMHSRKPLQALSTLTRLEKIGEKRAASLLYNRAVCMERLKEYRSAAGLYRKYLALYPRGEKVDVILWNNARRFEDKGNYSRAEALFRRLFEGFPKESFADKAAFKAPLCLFKGGAMDSAIGGFAFCESRYPESSQTDGCPYWIARCHEAGGRMDSAAFWLSRTVARNPFSFYGFRAADRLATGWFPETSVPPAEPPRDLERFLDSMGKNGRPLSKEAEDAYRRGVILAQCGLAGLAQDELRQASAEADRNPRFLYRLVRTYETFGFFTEAYRLSRKLIWRIPEREFGSLPPEILRIFFPRYFGEAVDLECQKYGLDPLFIHSIMRQESAYDARILSRAGAVGLLQLMPATAKVEARRLGIPFAPDSLSNPLYNIRVGVYHVVGLLDRLDHSKPLTLAAYNAGTAPVKSWRARTPLTDLDRFIEDIGYIETRNYVKKCMRNYWSYRKVWLP